MPVTSTSVLPAPITPKSTSATVKFVDRGQDGERGAEDDEPEPEVAGQPLARGERDAERARRGGRRRRAPVFSQPTPALPACRTRIASTTITTSSAPSDEHLRADEPDDHLQPSVGSDRAEAGEQLGHDRAVAGRSRAARPAGARTRRIPTMRTPQP